MARFFNESASDAVSWDSPINPTSGALTVCVWARGQATSADVARLVHNRNSGTEGWLLTKRSGTDRQKLGFVVASGGSLRVAGPSLTSLSDDAWHFACGTFQEGNAGFVRLYVDDMDTPEVSVTGTFGTYTAGALNLCVGKAGPVDGNHWKGAAAHLLVYDGLLGAGDRKAAKLGLLPRRDLLLLAAPLWGTHATEIDLSPNRHSGTVSGTSVVTGPPIVLFSSRWASAGAPDLPASGSPRQYLHLARMRG